MATGTVFEVVPLELNLRSNTIVEPRSIIARLRQGQRVRALVPGPTAGWLRVQADLQGTAVEGFVKASFLRAVAGSSNGMGAAPAAVPHLRAARLPSSGPIRRNQSDDGPRVFDLTEAHPGRPGPDAEKAAQLTDIIAFLRVSRSARYAAAGGKTYCNIYAHDYCHLADTYLPRVWWTRRALLALAAGGTVHPAYGTTVVELNANSLYNWLEEFGADFGWRRAVDLTAVQAAANAGQVCIVSAQRRDLNRPGHICAVVPETAQHRAARQAGGAVTTPLMSQAGASNFEYGGQVWWRAERFARHGFWVHA
ncbi:hypothetical protein [Hymenobacter sp.]|uniref:hypothetical protein n=1 Tax=Hymenobacter sp. TaxID=1898978 RepID=UPI00286CB365|nr:hypothetical protein [Hymenobacter sp.]